MYILIAPMADMTTMFYWALKYLTCYYLDFDIQLTYTNFEYTGKIQWLTTVYLMSSSSDNHDYQG